MFKKILSACLVLVLCLGLVACGDAAPTGTPSANGAGNHVSSPVTPNNNSNFAVNPLTGVQNLAKDKANLRPIAIMIDNDTNAQSYAQSGISKADIVYETETEGGITRLMAVFKDISSAPQLGDIRSARYVYVDLAMGHNAIYVHHGKDPDYCAPHLNDLDNFEIGEKTGAWRQTYGNVYSWQTLFSTGTKINENLRKLNWKMTESNSPLWQTFAAPDKSISLSSTANKITAGFNSSYKSYFTYDKATGNYIKTSNKCTNKDRNDGSKYEFKNVFILQTKMSYYGNQKYRRDIDLTGGEGYYAVNGTYEKIKWKKGNDSDPLVITKTDGTEIEINAGNSWVCFVKIGGDIIFE